MKKKNVLLVGLALAIGVGVFTGFDNNYYQEENDNMRAEIVSIKENADDVTREFIEKLENKERRDEAEFWQRTSDDGSIDYTQLTAYDQANDIYISGRIADDGVNIFLSKGDDRTWIDTSKNIYHADKRSDHNIPNISTTNELSFGEESIIRALDNSRFVEKTDFGYKVTISDDLNYGYDLYDNNANLYETYLENSEGHITSKLVDIDQDVLGLYDKYIDLTDSLTYTDDIADVK